jgi:hypothetical protein
MEEAAAVLAGALHNMLPEVIHSLAIRNKVTDSLKLIPRILRSIRICSHHSSSLSSLSNLSRELKEASGKAKKIWLFVISLQELMSHNWRQMERSKMAFYGGDRSKLRSITEADFISSPLSHLAVALESTSLMSFETQ